MSNIPVGLQLYTLRNETAEDFIGTLKQVAEMGYKVVEFAGYGDIPAEQMRATLDELGLRSSSAHISLTLGDLDKLKEELESHLVYNKVLGTEYIITPWAPIESYTTDEEFTQLYETLAYIGEEVNRQGFTYLYHNHAFELEVVRNGKPMLEEMYEKVSADLLQAELDLYWVKKGGFEPAAYLEDYKGRCPIVHIKDMTADERQYFAEVGQGIIDFKSVFAIAEDIGIKYFIVEQDSCERAPLESVRMSIEYLKSIGIA